jgi:hypothetical protein
MPFFKTSSRSNLNRFSIFIQGADPLQSADCGLEKYGVEFKNLSISISLGLVHIET